MRAAVAPRTARSIRHQVESRLHDLSKKQRLVGEYVVANRTVVLFATATEVAEAAGVDPATVVRFAQSFGFAGYPDFQDALRSEFPSLRSALDRLDDDVAEAVPGDTRQIVARVRAQTSSNLTRTFDRLDPGLIDATLDHLLGASRVVVVGAGQSTVLALHLYRALQTAQIPAQLLADWYDLLFDAANLRPGDALFGVTVWKYSRVTVEALRLAREAGARTILLTDAPFAPGAEFADVTLLFDPQAIGEYLSPVAGAAIIDCLAAGLATREPERVKRGMAIQLRIAATQGVGYG